MNQREMLKRVDASIEMICELGNFSRTTYFEILKGARKLSQLEIIGIQSLPKRRGKLPKSISRERKQQ